MGAALPWQEPIRSLFLFHTGSNVGYAIGPLEALFYRVGLELGGFDPQNVHMGYASLSRGRPYNLPQNFQNFIVCDFLHTKATEEIRKLARYVEEKRITFVMFFDMQPVAPIFKALLRAGAVTILSYWGAPISSMMPRWKLALKRLEIAFSNSKVDALIFESRAMAQLAVYGRGVPARMIDVVPLGVDVERFRPRESDHVYREFAFPRERKVVVYAGHMEERKGVATLVSAAVDLLLERRRRDVCFLLCGNVENQSHPYEKMYAGIGLDELIRFGGYRSDLAEIYPGCFCGVIPSTGWDSFPRTSVEMAAAGLPVVGSRLQGLVEAVLDRQTGLLYEPGNSRELANCLELLLENPALAADYGRNGRERCEAELNLEAQRNRLLAVIRRRLDERLVYDRCLKYVCF